jgi:hypothetical protein
MKILMMGIVFILTHSLYSQKPNKKRIKDTAAVRTRISKNADEGMAEDYKPSDKIIPDHPSKNLFQLP